jgi:hypothetical protein
MRALRNGTGMLVLGNTRILKRRCQECLRCLRSVRTTADVLEHIRFDRSAPQV